MTSTQVLLSPAELSYLHTSLSLRPPIRPDGRSPTQFRPLTAETGILPGANGSARICFADGTEAIVGIKAEVEKTPGVPDEAEDGEVKDEPRGRNEWVEMTVEIPGVRDDEAATVFLAEMLAEALLADGQFADKLVINRRFHWKLYLDILLISPPLSYPLPLLSLTAHLALLATRLPKLKSEGDEDPMFDDDWEAATYLYPKAAAGSRPPVTLLVVAIGDNIIFDPAKEELAVAEVALAVSVAEAPRTQADARRQLRLLSVRTIDPPSRLTPPGVPNSQNAAAALAGTSQMQQPQPPTSKSTSGSETVDGVWKAPLGGAKFSVLGAMIQKVLEPSGVADEVLDGLQGVELK